MPGRGVESKNDSLVSTKLDQILFEAAIYVQLGPYMNPPSPDISTKTIFVHTTRQGLGQSVLFQRRVKNLFVEGEIFQ